MKGGRALDTRGTTVCLSPNSWCLCFMVAVSARNRASKVTGDRWVTGK